MKIEIWSDIACPFCYIGKTHFEKALADFEHKSKVEVVYKSYQLDPEYHHKEGDTSISVLVEKKGMPEGQVRQMTGHVESMASQVGLSMDIQNTIPANTLDSHRLIHFAITEKKEKETIDALFHSHFTEAKNIEDKQVLTEVAKKVGLNQERTAEVLSSDEFGYDVSQDILESRNLGIRGVPFFLINRKYAVSGAQPMDAFRNALKQTFEEWQKENEQIVSLNSAADDGSSCSVDGCD